MHRTGICGGKNLFGKFELEISSYFNRQTQLFVSIYYVYLHRKLTQINLLKGYFHPVIQSNS